MNYLIKKSPVTSVVAAGIGAAIFFFLGRFVAIPMPIPNTTMSLQYGILAIFALVFGPAVALFVGFIGHLLIDISYGQPWWSWIITSGLVGLIMGIILIRVREVTKKNVLKTAIKLVVAIAVANLVGWIIIAPTLDVLVYAEPANKVLLQGISAGISNTVFASIVGTILLYGDSRWRTESGSLKVQD